MPQEQNGPNSTLQQFSPPNIARPLLVLHVVARLRRASLWAAEFVLITGCIGLLAWLTGAACLHAWRAGALALKPSSALACVLAACALLLRRNEHAPQPVRAAASVCAGLVALLGLVYIVVPLSGASFGLETLLKGVPASSLSVRMSPTVGGLVFAIGLGLLGLDWEDARGRRPAQALFLLAALFSIAAFGMELFDTGTSRNAQSRVLITPMMALNIGVIGLAALAARPDRGRMRVVTADAMGGMVARGLLPVAMLAPLALCVLCYLGYLAKLYDSGLGLALLTAANSTVLTAFVWRTATSLNEADMLRRAAEQERNALNVRLQRSMAETHHRVRNNLQFIAALADMQVLDGQDTVPVSEMQRIGAQVSALASIHAILTRESKTDGTGDSLSAAEVIGKLAEQLRTSANGRGIVVRADDTEITGRQASALAIIVNELVTNALKNSSGDVCVEFQSRDGSARLAVMDDGAGFPEGFDPVKQANTGLELVQQMSTWDLQGSVAFTNGTGGGARVVVDIPLSGVVAGHGAAL
jgi:two-component sensor histidine kinase